MARIALSIAALGIVGLFGLAVWLGALTSVAVEERSMGPYHFVYRALEGADPLRVGAITTEIARTLQAAGVAAQQPLDLFQPDGSGQPNEIGWIIAERDGARAAAQDASLLQRTIPEAPALVARFPWKHPLSYVVGFFRVVPALRAHREAHGYQDGPSYSVNAGDHILYVQPIVH